MLGYEAHMLPFKHISHFANASPISRLRKGKHPGTTAYYKKKKENKKGKKPTTCLPFQGRGEKKSNAITCNCK